MERMEVVGGYRYCAKRDNSYNYLTLEKPSNVTNGDSWEWQCSSSSKFTKLCGTSQERYRYVSCIPATS